MEILICHIFISLLITAVDTIPIPEIYCKLPHNQHCSDDGQLELYEETAKISIQRDKCTKHYEYDYLIVPPWYFNDSTILEQRFKCRYYEGNEMQESKIESIPWVYCSHDSQDCVNSDCPNDNEHVCMWTRNGPRQCSKLDHTDYCKSEFNHYRYCPVNEVGGCSSALKNRSAIWYQITNHSTHKCIDASSPPVTYKEKALLHGEIFEFDPAVPYIHFDCPIDSPFFNMMIDIDGKAVKKREATCISGMNVHLDSWHHWHFSLGITNIYHIYLTVSQPDGLAHFIFRVVRFETELTLKPSKLKNAVVCEHDFSAVLPFSFRASRWVTKKGSETKIQGFMDWHFNFNITESGLYQCHAEIIFQTCAPHTKFVKKLESRFVNIEYQTTTTTTQTTVSQSGAPTSTKENKNNYVKKINETTPSGGSPLLSLVEIHLTALAFQFMTFSQI